MIQLSTAFKQFGKTRIVNYIMDYHTKRINHDMKIDKILYILDGYGYTDGIEEHLNTFRNSVDFWNIRGLK